MNRKTKIVCTIGPASSQPEMMRRLILAGMDVARLNFSHGTQEAHLEIIRNLRRLAMEVGKRVAILQDLGGPKIRVGNFGNESVKLRPGDPFVLTTDSVSGDWQRVSVSYPELPAEVEVGDAVLLADGMIELRVKAIRSDEVETEVVVGGLLSSRKGINLPNRSLKIPAFTTKDEADLEFGLHHDIDFVALSYVRRPEDLRLPIEIMARSGKEVPIIAKIEKQEAIENIDGIIAEVDGIMVARGDLGIETRLERVPLLQKMLIAKTNSAGKPVITATQMLRSMVDNPRPTRAEATDVANAVMDGTDAIMLSEETASGNHPVDAVRVMASIAEETEAQLMREDFPVSKVGLQKQTTAEAIGHAACLMAEDLNATAIFAATQTGNTARLISSFRPRATIYGITPLETTGRRLNLSWGVVPFLSKPFQHTDDLFMQVRDLVIEHGLAESGDVVIVTAGVPVGVSGTTNMIKALVV